MDEFREYCDRIIELVEDSGDMSLLTATNALLSKQFAVGAASMFEVDLCERVLTFVRSVSAGNNELLCFVNNKAVTRQYHTWFSWKEKNANAFFSSFGKDFREYMRRRVAGDESLDASIHAFIELGADRNRIVHGDFLNCSYDKTLAEVYELYRRASSFVQLFPDVLIEFGSKSSD